MSVNKVILVGNLGRDPELRYTASGTAVANFTIATSERFKDRNGQMQERTEWHNIVVWRNLAEICGKYLHKGKQVYIEGKLATRKWQDRDGNDRYTTEIVADQMQMLGRAGDDGGQGAYGGGGGNYSSGGGSRRDSGSEGRGYQGNAPQNAPADFEEPPFNPDDDIPF